MSLSPPAPLLRLREADVVRLCGFDAATQGREYVARHAVTSGRRADARLSATVVDDTPHSVWIEVGEGGGPGAARWSCSCAGPSGEQNVPAPEGTRGCAHVAAVLSAWIRSPGDFVTTGGTDAPTQTLPPLTGRPERPEHPRPIQPALLAARTTSGPRRSTTLMDELARLPSADVQAAARRVFGVAAGEAEARALLAAGLRDPIRLGALVARLEEDPRTLLIELLLLGGAMTASDLDALATRSERAPAALRADMSVLERHALVFRVSGAAGAVDVGRGTSGRPWREIAGWRVAPETRAAFAVELPLRAVPPGELRSHPVAVEAAHGRSDAHPRGLRVTPASLRHICLALALLAHAPRPYGPLTGDAPRSEQRGGSAGKGDERLFPLIAGDLAPGPVADFARGSGVLPGLVRLARRVLLWARDEGDGGPLMDLASVPPAERALALRAGFRVWRMEEAPAELADLALSDSPLRARFDLEHSALRPAALAAEVAGAREVLLSLLERAAPRVWLPVDGLLQLIWRLNPLFLRGRQQAYATPAWWLERADERRPLRPNVHAEWMAGEGEYVRALLAGPLYWWGAVDLALATNEVATAFRVTDFGRFLFDRDGDDGHQFAGAFADGWGQPALPTREGTLAVQPLAAGPSLLTALAAWSRPVAVAGGRLVYALTPELVAASLDRGISPATLLHSLRTADPTGAARAWAAFEPRLSAWQQVYGNERITSGWAILEARDEATLAEALALVPEIAARCQRVAPAVVLVAPDDLIALRKTLARRGYQL